VDIEGLKAQLGGEEESLEGASDEAEMAQLLKDHPALKDLHGANDE